MCAVVHVHGVLAASLIVSLMAVPVGCRRVEDEPPQPSFRVRVLTSQPTSGRWERATEQGLGRIAAELDADVARIRAGDEGERRARFTELGQAGVDLVFCVGPEFDELLYTEAAGFPATRFVVVPGDAGGANVAGIEFLPEGAAYVAGVVAAHLRGGAMVGVLRGTGGGWLEQLEEGFVTGFRSVRRSAEQMTVAPPEGPWELVAAGVEVALYATDQADEKVLAEAHDSGLVLVATDVDLLEREPDVVAAAVHVDVAEAMVRVAREVRDDTFQGGPYVFDFGSGVLDVLLNPTMPATTLTALQEALEVARSEVTAGIVEVEELVF
jgi:basic membrane lipoprotein Med (substrate-binding protein (PBP1-ABC) superfamily)